MIKALRLAVMYGGGIQKMKPQTFKVDINVGKDKSHKGYFTGDWGGKTMSDPLEPFRRRIPNPERAQPPRPPDETALDDTRILAEVLREKVNELNAMLEWAHRQGLRIKLENDNVMMTPFGRMNREGAVHMNLEVWEQL